MKPPSYTKGKSALHPHTFPFPSTGEGDQGALSGCNCRADFGAPLFDFSFDHVADVAGAGELLVVAALQGRRVGEAPVQAGSAAWENRAAFGAGFVADSDDVVE